MAVVNLPDNPSDGDTQDVGGITYTYNSSKGYWTAAASSGGGGGGGASVTTDDTAPSNPSDGDLWWDSDGGKMYVYYEDADSSQWVSVSVPGSTGPAGADGPSASVAYANFSAFPATPTEGDIAYAQDTNALYVYKGTAWSRIDNGEESPVILTEPPTTTQELNNDGTTSTVTMTAQDPEGFDITYGIAYKTANNTRPSQLSADTTIDQSTGVYTFTPTTTQSNAGSFRARLSASDGANTTTRFVDFSLAFSGEFNTSPDINGSSTFTLSANNPLNLGTTGTYTITPTVGFTATISMWGAGGGGGWQGGSGGGGGFSTGTYTFEVGQTYYILVGQGGRSSTGTATGGGGSSDTARGGGGGYTGLFTGSSATHGNAIIIAGGGGGGGGGSGSGPAGAGGGSTGEDGNNGSGAQPGGGTQSAGGSASGGSSSAAGSALTGANGLSGGGGGYYGGGSGGDHGSYAPSGGGGSGYIGGTGLSNASTATGSTTTPAQDSNTLRNGAGSPSIGEGNGSDGRFYMSLG